MGMYHRRRATSLLSGWKTTTVESYLTWLATASTERKLRWIASYTYMRAFAQKAPKRVLDFAETQLKSTLSTDRDAAVRGLRHVLGKRADALLEKASRTETDRVILTVLKRIVSARK